MSQAAVSLMYVAGRHELISGNEILGQRLLQADVLRAAVARSGAAIQRLAGRHSAATILARLRSATAASAGQLDDELVQSGLAVMRLPVSGPLAGYVEVALGVDEAGRHPSTSLTTHLLVEEDMPTADLAVAASEALTPVLNLIDDHCRDRSFGGSEHAPLADADEHASVLLISEVPSGMMADRIHSGYDSSGLYQSREGERSPPQLWFG